MLALWFGFNYLSSHVWTTKTTIGIHNIIIGSVHNVHELTTATMDIKESVVLDKEAKLFGIQVGNTHLVYVGIGQVQAGLDLDKIRVIGNLDEESSQESSPMQIILPASTITSVILDVDRSSTLANYTEWFGRKAGIDLYEKAQQKAIEAIRSQACKNQILEAASNNAAVVIQNILANVGVENFEIEAHSSSNRSDSFF